MNYAELANDGVLKQPIYEPGKPIEDVARDFGLDPSEIAKLASNENPLGASPRAQEAMKAAIGSSHLYPDGGCQKLREKIADRYDLEVENITVGNGSNEIIELLGHAFLCPGREVVMGSQAFIVYKLVTHLFGATPIEVPMRDFAHDLEAMRAAVTDQTRLVFVASPNNPTGVANSSDELIAFARSLPDSVTFCLDEAYAEYLSAAPDLRQLIKEGRKVICLRTFSKIYGLGGLRIGYGYGPKDLIEILNRVRQPFNVNAIAQAGAMGALEDETFVESCFKANASGRQQLVEGFKALQIEVVAGDANFVMAKVEDGVACFKELQKKGVIIRPLTPYGLQEWVRITIGRPEENSRVLEEIGTFMSVASIK